MSGDPKVDAELLLGYHDLDEHPPRPMGPWQIQRIRDAVDPRGADDVGIPHRCEKCSDCIGHGDVVEREGVRALLQHIDYLQGELDKIERAAIDWMGDGE